MGIFRRRRASQADRGNPVEPKGDDISQLRNGAKDGVSIVAYGRLPLTPFMATSWMFLGKSHVIEPTALILT